MSACAECGGVIVQPSGRGRPRKFCEICRPGRTEQARLADNAARRVKYRAAHPLVVRFCEECGAELEGHQAVLCSKRACKDARHRWLHPEAEKAKQARKYERRRLRAFRNGEGSSTAGLMPPPLPRARQGRRRPQP